MRWDQLSISWPYAHLPQKICSLQAAMAVIPNYMIYQISFLAKKMTVRPQRRSLHPNRSSSAIQAASSDSNSVLLSTCLSQLVLIPKWEVCRQDLFSPPPPPHIDADSQQVYDVETGKIVTTYVGHTNGVRTCTFSPDDANFIVTGSYDTTVKVTKKFMPLVPFAIVFLLCWGHLFLYIYILVLGPKNWRVRSINKQHGNSVFRTIGW